MPIVNCKICSKEFYIKPNRLKRGWGKYCSNKCSYEGQKTGGLFVCQTCGKQVYRGLKNQARSQSGKYFCNKTCQTRWRNSIYVGKNHSNWRGGTGSYRDILRRTKATQICARCKNNDRRVLIVHHIDRNRSNNAVSNLTWMCHNCHFLVHHYENEAKKFVVPVA